jgi:exopolyphosphatase/pppGpp-phosphohydrolase
MGSSGIRAGASHSDTTKRVNVDYLTPLWAGRGLDETIATTISALRDLPAKAGFAVECARVGGGSLQISGAHSTFGDALGQKIWHRTLCDELRATTSTPCALQPMTDQELTRARTLLAKKLSGIATTLPANVTMTAISRPVSRGVMPAVQHLAGETAATKVLQRSTLTKAIQRITAMTSEETATLLGSTKAHAAYLLSDMLLVEGLLQATNANELHVAELDLTNLPGLLADDRAFLWSDRYDCYLERLPSLGLDA